MIWCPQCRRLVEPCIVEERWLYLKCPDCGYVFTSSRRSLLDLSEEKRRLKLWAKGLSDVEMAREIGLTPSAVKSWRARRGLPCNRPSRKMKLYQRFLDAVPGVWVPARIVAEKLGCSSIRAAKILGHLADRGNIERIKNGRIFLYRRVT